MSTLTDQGRSFIIIVIILTVLATCMGATRLYIRRRGLLAVDDYILSFCLVLLWFQAVGASLLCAKGGVGKHFADLSESEVTWLFKMFYAPEIGYTILVASVKMSILFSYKRIFGRIRWVKHYIHVLMGLSGAWGIGCTFVIIFQCWPIEKVWKPMMPGGCIDLLAFLWGSAVSNFLIDWAVLAVPLVPIWKLQMSKVQKCLVAGSFALGSVACIASTTRAAVTGTIDVTDLPKSVFLASIWTYIEPTVAIISACLPFFGKFFTDRVRKMGSGNGSGRRGKGLSYHDHGITKRTVTTVSDESKNTTPNQHELMGYSVRVGNATSDGRMRLNSESEHSLV